MNHEQVRDQHEYLVREVASLEARCALLRRIVGMGGFASSPPEEMFLSGWSPGGCDAWLTVERVHTPPVRPLDNFTTPVRYVRGDIADGLEARIKELEAQLAAPPC